MYIKLLQTISGTCLSFSFHRSQNLKQISIASGSILLYTDYTNCIKLINTVFSLI